MFFFCYLFRGMVNIFVHMRNRNYCTTSLKHPLFLFYFILYYLCLFVLLYCFSSNPLLFLIWLLAVRLPPDSANSHSLHIRSVFNTRGPRAKERRKSVEFTRIERQRKKETTKSNIIYCCVSDTCLFVRVSNKDRQNKMLEVMDVIRRMRI